MKNMAEYWKTFAEDWERSSYDKKAGGLSLLEKIATMQREHIAARKQSGEEYLARWIQNKSFFEIGCGGGAFTISLLARGAASGVGIDVSPEVIKVAQAKAQREIPGKDVRFIAGVIENSGLPIEGRDIGVGLGILEYLEPKTVEQLLKTARPKEVFFSFHERHLTLKSALHFFYRQLKRFPYYKTYPSQEIVELFQRSGYPKVKVFREKNNSFITSV